MLLPKKIWKKMAGGTSKRRFLKRPEKQTPGRFQLETLEPRMLLSIFFPDPNAHGPYALLEGNELNLEASGSHSLFNLVGVKWDLDNNGTYETDAGTELNYTVSWDALQALDLPSNGTGNEIGLQMTFTGIMSGNTYHFCDNSFLTINNADPAADAGGDYEIDEGQPLFLNASGTSDPDANDILNYEWDLDNDGSYDYDSGPNPTPVIAWSEIAALDPSGIGAGDGVARTITLRVKDHDGGVATATAELTVNNLAPVVDAGEVYAVHEGESVTLEGYAADPNENDTLVSYKWDLDNDGNFDGALDQAGQTITLNWSELQQLGLTDDGDFTQVKLAVTDNNGGTGYDTAMILVLGNSAPNIKDIRVGSYDNNYYIFEGDKLHLRASATDAGSDKLRFLWDLDGDKVYDDAAGCDTWVSWNELEELGYNNLYQRIGLMVIDDDGDFDYASTKVFVWNVCPNANAGGGFKGEYQIEEGQSLVLDGSGSYDKNANDCLSYWWKLDVNGDIRYWYAGHDEVTTIPWRVLETWGVKGQGDSDPIEVTLKVFDDVWFNQDTATLYVNNVNPTADAGGPYVINEGQSLNLKGYGSDPNDNDLLTFAWDLDNDGHYDDAFGEDPAPISWNNLPSGLKDDGTSLTVGLKVTDPDGGVATDRMLLLVINNLSPSVNADGPYEINEGDALQLSGSASDPGGDPLTYLWDLDNDGAFDDAATANPTVSWDYLKLLNLNTNGDANTIALMANDGENGVNIATTTLVINNVAPTAEAGSNVTIDEGQDALFVGSFTDPYGDLDGPYSFSWNFGDGSAEANTEHAAHMYVDNGVFTVTYTVTDKDGGAGVDTLTVTVMNVAPSVDAGEDKVSVEGHQVAFSGKFTDPGKNDTHTILWDFGDGSTANTLNALHTYADNGNYTATLTITDDDGGVGVDMLTVYVENANPQVYAGQDAGIEEGQTITFVGTFTDVVPDSAPQPTFLWEFGDGSTANTLTADHTYPQNGVYVARFTVTDKDGGVSFNEATIIVSNVPPTANAGSDRLVNMDESVLFAGSFTDPGILDTHTYLWDFGDGHTATALNAIHTYTESGIYTAALTVLDGDYGQTTDTIQVTVQELLEIVNNEAFLHTKTGLVVVTLTGPGELTEVAHIEGTGLDFNTVILHDTTELSSLKIRTVGVPRSFTNLGDVTVNSSLGNLKAATANLKGDVQILTGGVGSVKLMSLQEQASITTGVGGINKVLVKNDIAGTIDSATSIGTVVSRKGGLASTAAIIANTGEIGKANFAGDVKGMLLAEGAMGNVSSSKGSLSGTIRAGESIGKLRFSEIDSATISAGGDIGAVVSKTSIVDSLLLAGFDIGLDGLPGTGDEVFNANGAEIGFVKVHPKNGYFDGSYAMAGIKPYDYDINTRMMLAPIPSLQVRASYGAIDKATVGQVFPTGSPEIGIYGLFAATEDITKVKFTEITASGAPLFEVRSQWL